MTRDELLRLFPGDSEQAERVRAALAEIEGTNVRAREVAARHDAAERQRLFALFEEAPFFISVMEGPEFRVAMVNRYARTVVPTCSRIGTLARDLYPAGDSTIAKLERVYTTGIPEGVEEVTFDHVPALAGRWFTRAMAPVRDTSGQIAGVMTAGFEITEQRRAARQLEEQSQALEAARNVAVEAVRVKDEFLAMLGHELRNPLAPMVTVLEIMRLRGACSREQELLERQVAHLNRLVDDLLDIGRITRGRIELRHEPIELSTVVRNALELSSPLLEQRDERIINRVPDHGFTVSGDPDRLAQIVANLMTNAAKYSDVGSVVEISATRTDKRICLCVKDSGVGIAPEMIPTLFDPFVQQPQTLERARGGLGLGLAIVRGLVEAHGGTVAVRSEGIGKGSEFIVELPAHDASSDVAGPSVQPPPVTTHPKRILVVDDNRDAAIALEYGLAALGHKVAVALDGPSALEVARTFNPDVALLDIGLPVMDGYDLAERLRADRDIVLIAITGYGQESDRQRSAEAGFAEHLVKPVSLLMLDSVVQRLAA